MTDTDNEKALQEMDTFKSHVRTWLQLDDKISNLQQQIKGYKQQQKELTPLLIHFMNVRDIREISSNEGNIRFDVAKSRASLSNKKLQSSISTFFNNEEQTKELIDHIMENRVIKETIRLKRYE